MNMKTLKYAVIKTEAQYNTYCKTLEDLLESIVTILGVSKGLVSDILNYKKRLSKEIIRMLAGYFKVSQEAFNSRLLTCKFEMSDPFSPMTD
jgi:antitoxin component HigA of HigAB toxin-antitoxin module